jgi:hypothetical protein
MLWASTPRGPKVELRAADEGGLTPAEIERRMVRRELRSTTTIRLFGDATTVWRMSYRDYRADSAGPDHADALRTQLRSDNSLPRAAAGVDRPIAPESGASSPLALTSVH